MLRVTIILKHRDNTKWVPYGCCWVMGFFLFRSDFFQAPKKKDPPPWLACARSWRPVPGCREADAGLTKALKMRAMRRCTSFVFIRSSALSSEPEAIWDRLQLLPSARYGEGSCGVFELSGNRPRDINCQQRPCRLRSLHAGQCLLDSRGVWISSTFGGA